MIKLNAMFVLLLLTAWARYLVYGAFELKMFLLVFLLPIFSIVIYYFGKRIAKKEYTFTPRNRDEWSMYYAQSVLHTPKSLYKENKKRGELQVYFQQRWHYLVDKLVGDKSPWYLSLKVTVDECIYDVKWFRKKKFNKDENWKIYKDGDQIGKATTNIKLKNVMKFKEVLAINIGELDYQILSYTVNGTATIYQDEELVGSVKREHLVSRELLMEVKDDNPDLLVGLLLFRWYFKG